MNLDERQAKQLHYDVMGIALAIRGHMGESGVFQVIDAALTGLDWSAMSRIQSAFNMLSPARQELIMADLGDPDEVGRSIAMFERTLHQMDVAAQQLSA